MILPSWGPGISGLTMLTTGLTSSLAWGKRKRRDTPDLETLIFVTAAFWHFASNAHQS